MTLSKILVAVDRSEISKRAFEYASFLAEKCNTSLLIVNIPDIFERVGRKQKKLEEIAKKIEKGEIDNKAMLRKFESQAKEHGVKDVSTIKQRGNVAEEILKIADKENVDMIYLVAEDLVPLKNFF